MDFITELTQSNGYDAILVIVDKLTKYGLFIPVHTTDTAVDTARVVFNNVIAHYGVPRKIVSDLDRMWSGEFWKEVCLYLDIKRLMATTYHPQTEGQMENLNQTLEIALQAYINASMNLWITGRNYSQVSHFPTIPFNTHLPDSLQPFFYADISLGLQILIYEILKILNQLDEGRMMSMLT